MNLWHWKRSVSFVVLSCFTAMVILPKPCEGDDPSLLTVTLDGVPISPHVLSLSGTPDEPREGDLFYVDDLLLAIGPERAYRFRSTPREDGRLLLERDGKPTQVVGIRVSLTFQDDQKVVLDPLTKLSPDEVRGLWGVSLNHWSDAIAEKLKHIDPTQLCISVQEDVAQGDMQALPELPTSLRYLLIEPHSSDGINDVSSLRKLTQLRFLAFDSIGIRKLDAVLIKEAHELRYLDLGGADIDHASELANLAELRHLELRHSNGFNDVSFVRQLRSLRRLGLAHTQVSDLSSLAAHPALTWINADMAPVTKLPQDQLPGLRTLQVMQTKLTDDAVAAFAKDHPDCTIFHRWGNTLVAALSKATRLRVRSGGTCHRDRDEEKTLFETENATDIRTLLDGITIDEKKSGFH